MASLRVNVIRSTSRFGFRDEKTMLNFCPSSLILRRLSCQGSSVVEQGTHKPLVGSSTLPPGTNFTPRQRLARSSAARVAFVTARIRAALGPSVEPMLQRIPAGKRGILKKLLLSRGGNSQRVQPAAEHADELLGNSAVVRNHVPRLRRIGSKMIQLGTLKLLFRGIKEAPFVRQ